MLYLIHLMPHQAFDHSNYGFYSNQISQQSLATSRYFPLELNQGQNLYKGPCGRRPKNVDLDFRVVVEHQFARFLPLNIYIMLF